MASVIDNLDLDPLLKARLKAQAREHGRTADQEACAILAKGLGPGKLPGNTKGVGSAIHAMFLQAGAHDIPQVTRELAKDPVELDP